jgi:hypothetical protein
MTVQEMTNLLGQLKIAMESSIHDHDLDLLAEVHKNQGDAIIIDRARDQRRPPLRR